jgi:carbon storage regulator
MLVLTRRSNEALRIGDNIKITVVEVKGNQVRLGIEAPAEIPIYREEIYRKVMEENRLSAGISVEIFGKIKEVIKGK